jgi:thiol-disulfide isomerase/thioredoxin
MVKVIALVLLGLLGVVLLMQLGVRLRARGFRGKPVPKLPGEIGRKVADLDGALLYFFGPNCAACRPLTPRIRELADTNPAVLLVDVSRDLAVAQALGVMATPTVVEVGAGRVQGYYVGMPPQAVLERFRR